jgi:membrane-associated phospholipid phosphatase
LNDGIPLPRLRSITRLWACAAVLAGLGVAALAVDGPLAVWVESGRAPSFLNKLCGLSEVFGHAAGVLAILAAVGVLDPAHRFAIPRIAAASLGSGLVANVLKLLVARTRPHHFDLTGDALDSFGGWLPLLGNASWQQGFPSSHMATAAGLAIALTCLYPRGRWLFPALAALAGMQRVLSQAHFASDVLWGAAVGCIFAPLCMYGSALARTFDSLERQWMARSIATARPPRHHYGAAPASRSHAAGDDVPSAA